MKVGDLVIRKRDKKFKDAEVGTITGIRRLVENEYARVQWPHSNREIRLDALLPAPAKKGSA